MHERKDSTNALLFDWRILVTPNRIWTEANMRRLMVICALLLTSCNSGKEPNPGPQNVANPDNTAVPVRQADEKVEKIFNSSDALVQLLQGRVLFRLRDEGTRGDFQLQPVGVFVYPIGALMPEGRTVAKNRTACAPPADKLPSAYAMPDTFNSIKMTGKVALELGLNEIISALANADLKVGQDDTFELSVKDAKGQFLLDDELDEILKLPACKAYLTGKTMNLVRGYVIGQRSYLVGRSKTATGGAAGLGNVGKFKVSAANDKQVSVVDAVPVEFLQIVSRVSLPAEAASAAVPTVTAPATPEGTGKVYVQRDAAGNDGDAARVQKLLDGLSMEVVKKIERVESRKMPKAAQVRYFNNEDEALAQRTANKLKEIFPDAAKVYVGLKAPPKQLEVWLPRVGT
jgi:hypothetical protein